LLEVPGAPPLTLSLTQFSPDKIYHLSCGYGPLWKISKKGPITHTSSINIALGLESGFAFKSEELPISEGDKFILCPLSETGHIFSDQQFAKLLEDEKHLPPQPLAESILKKAKSLFPRYFDDHPFTVAVIEFT